MSNIFATDVQKQFYMEGLQDNLRDSVPMLLVSEVETENAEYIVNRYGADVDAQSTKNSLYRRATGFSYSADKKSIDEIATATDVILYQELMREGFDIVADRQDKHAYALRKAIHRHSVNTAVQSAGSTLDNEVLAGNTSAGTPITLTSSNPDEVTAAIVQILQEENAYGEQTPFVMMTPRQAKFFNVFAQGAGFSVADRALTNSIFTVAGGTRVVRGAQNFGGLDVIVTNEMPRAVVLTFADETDETDTIVIKVGADTVTLTCDASPDGAGDYDQGASAAETIEAAVALINNSEGTLASTISATGEYYELSAANRAIFDRAYVRARKLSSTTMEITAFEKLVVTETGDEVTVGTHKEYMLAGAYNAVTVALPTKGMRSDEKPLAAAVGGTGTHGFELTTLQMHDAVVWTNNAGKLVAVPCV
ncbi:MAG: hypothetical protein IPO40_24400 [Fibrobacteres bacterium]|nr:hypothetical protein [Fibrobacterota bacterium]